MSSSNTRNRISKTAGQVAESSKEFVGEHTVSTAMAAFGLGVGAGVAIALLLSGNRQRQEMGVAHRLGRQVLDAMTNAVPESLAKFNR